MRADNDERRLIVAISEAEAIDVRYTPLSADELHTFQARDVLAEPTEALLEEHAVIAAAAADGVQVLLSGWGGDEFASFNGRGALAGMLRHGRLATLALETTRRAGGVRHPKSVAGVAWRQVVVPSLPDTLRNRVGGVVRQGRGGHPRHNGRSPVDLGDGVATVTSFGRSIHVAPATARALGVDAGTVEHVLADSGKLVLPGESRLAVQLGRVIVLDAASDVAEVRVEHVSGADAVGLLVAHAYRAALVRQLWPEALFGWSTRLASMVSVARVSRPAAAWTVPAVADAVERRAVATT